MMVQPNVLVFIEIAGDRIADVSLELICKGAGLAGDLGGAVEAVAPGSGIQAALAVLGRYGCRLVYAIDDPRLARFTSVPYAKSVQRVIEKTRPQIVLFGATTTGRDIAPRIASALRCGLTADCTDLQIGPYKLKGKTYDKTLLQIRPAFGGNIVATIVSPESAPSMATVRPGVVRMHPPEVSGAVEIVEEPCPVEDADLMSEVIEVVREEKTAHLSGARVIVAAGMGAASAAGIGLVRDLARVLGGEVGASRPVVDAGLLPKAHQVGQTGTTVRPNLYIACGISGQIQHRAGMVESKRIIAINRDPHAPIFDIAHYGIVGDVTDVLPKMINAYKAK